MYALKDIKYETRSFWVLDVGAKGFEVYKKSGTHSTKVSSIGNGPTLGIARAIAEADRRQAVEDKEHDARAAQHRKNNPRRRSMKRKKNSTATRTEVRSPTRTEVRSPTKTSTVATTKGNRTSTSTDGSYNTTNNYAAGSRKTLKKNPHHTLYTLRAQGHGKPLFYDGKRFASHPSHVKTFPTLLAARLRGEHLIDRNPLLKKYKVTVHSK